MNFNGLQKYTAQKRLISRVFPRMSLLSHRWPLRCRCVAAYALPGCRRPQRGLSRGRCVLVTETTTYAYDNANRLVARQYSDALNDGFTYDTAS
jgi:hypothetical protein